MQRSNFNITLTTPGWAGIQYTFGFCFNLVLNVIKICAQMISTPSFSKCMAYGFKNNFNYGLVKVFGFIVFYFYSVFCHILILWFSFVVPIITSESIRVPKERHDPLKLSNLRKV